MTTEPLDPAAIMAAHAAIPDDVDGPWCAVCVDGQHDYESVPWPCQPYQLAEQVVRLTAERDAALGRALAAEQLVAEAARTGWCPCCDNRPENCRPEQWRESRRHGSRAALAGEGAADE